jgi:hypothetical protein
MNFKPAKSWWFLAHEYVFNSLKSANYYYERRADAEVGGPILCSVHGMDITSYDWFDIIRFVLFPNMHILGG